MNRRRASKRKLPRPTSSGGVKDIFVDDCVASRLENPLDPKLKTFLEWLIKSGSIVLTQKIINEYQGSLSRGGSSTFIAVLAQLQRDGRSIFIPNDKLKAYKIPKSVEKTLQSNREDWWHLKAVILSYRKFALSFDDRFVRDVNAFPSVSAKAAREPSQLPYR